MKIRPVTNRLIYQLSELRITDALANSSIYKFDNPSIL